jgi:hypothetical protein
MTNGGTEDDKWDKAQEAGIFDDAPGPVEPFMPQDDPYCKKESAPANADVDYWREIYAKSMGQSMPSGMLNEQGIPPMPNPVEPGLSKPEIQKIAKSAANAANPTRITTVGKDQDYKPNWSDVRQLEQLHDMKINLYELESKLNHGHALAETKKGQKVQTQINNLKKEIDALSDALSPDFLQSYLS